MTSAVAARSAARRRLVIMQLSPLALLRADEHLLAAERLLVERIVQFDPQPVQAAEDLPADLDGVLADPAGEHQGVDASQGDGRVRAGAAV